MADVFTVSAFDINTNSKICELPASGLKFDSRLNDAGAVSFTIKLDAPKVAAAVEPFLDYDGMPVALYVDRDGVIVWAGWAKTGNYQHSTHLLQVGGKEWLDIFSQRWTVAPYDQPTYPNGLDPALLLYKALTDAQNFGLGSNYGITVVGGSSSLPWIVPSYTLGQSFVGQVVKDMTAVGAAGIGSLDLWMDARWSGQSPQVTAHIAFPRAGRPAGTTGLMFDLLAATDHTWPTDISTGCSVLWEVGGGTGQAAPQTGLVVPNMPIGGLGQMPRLDKTIQHTNILDPNLLSAVAYGEAVEYGGPIKTPTVTIPTAHPATPLGTWIMGDDARLFAEPYERHPNGLDEFWRIVAQSVTVPDEGVPTVQITFNSPPVF